MGIILMWRRLRPLRAKVRRWYIQLVLRYRSSNAPVVWISPSPRTSNPSLKRKDELSTNRTATLSTNGRNPILSDRVAPAHPARQSRLVARRCAEARLHWAHASEGRARQRDWPVSAPSWVSR